MAAASPDNALDQLFGEGEVQHVVDIRQFFHFSESDILGKGQFAVVYRCRKAQELVDDEVPDEAAIRIVSLSKYHELLQQHVFKKIDNVHIIKLHRVYVDENNLYFVMELARGGDLFSTIRRFKGFSEHHAALVCLAISNGLEHLHTRNIGHFDVKPFNILVPEETAEYSTENDDTVFSSVKLGDLGLAALVPRERLKGLRGTLAYCAPEILRGASYGLEADVWSLGVTLFELLFGHHPFAFDCAAVSPDDRDYQQKVCSRILSFPGFYGPVVAQMRRVISEEAADLLQKLMEPDPSKRLKVAEIRHHKWMQTEQVLHARVCKSLHAPEDLLRLYQTYPTHPLGAFLRQNGLSTTSYVPMSAGEMDIGDLGMQLHITSARRDVNGDGAKQFVRALHKVVDPKTMATELSEGALDALVHVMNYSTAPGIIYDAVAVVNHLSSLGKAIKLSLARNGVLIDCLIEIACDTTFSNHRRQLAAKVLASLAQVEPGYKAIVKLRGVSPIVCLIDSDQADFQHIAIAALEVLCRDKETAYKAMELLPDIVFCLLLCEGEEIVDIARVAESDRTLTARKRATIALAGLASNASVVSHLLSANIIAVLLPLLKEGDQEICTIACAALGNLVTLTQEWRSTADFGPEVLQQVQELLRNLSSSRYEPLSFTAKNTAFLLEYGPPPFSPLCHPCVKYNRFGELRNNTNKLQTIILPLLVAEGSCRFTVHRRTFSDKLLVGFVCLQEGEHLLRQLPAEGLGSDLRSWALDVKKGRKRHFRVDRIALTERDDRKRNVISVSLEKEKNCQKSVLSFGVNDGNMEVAYEGVGLRESMEQEGAELVSQPEEARRARPLLANSSQRLSLHAALTLGPHQHVCVPELSSLLHSSEPMFVCSFPFAGTEEDTRELFTTEGENSEAPEYPPEKRMRVA